MTHNQVAELPEGALIKRKTQRAGEPCFGTVIEPACDVDDYIIIGWEQESNPFFNNHYVDDVDPEDSDDWRDLTRWLVERVPVYSKHHKTWWRNWKRVA